VDGAKRLLETTSLSVEEIMERVGYDDPSSFRKLFERITRVSPRQYRRMFSLRRK
jgi:transcriptional regulator GlxA family with amidase domain